jgi:(S)-2-hydroxyglutarate dehydrogenase
MRIEKFDLAVIGAGIIGLSVAWKFLSRNPNSRIAIIDKEDAINKHQTGRNSGVIHSGIYYKQGSYKSKNCLDGYQQMLSFVKEYDIPYKITGKAIVATNEVEAQRLVALYENGRNVGLKLEWLDAKQIPEIHHGLVGARGIWVPETGLTSYGLVSQKLLSLLKEAGAQTFFNEQFQVKDANNNGNTTLNLSNTAIEANYVVNAAGLHCDRVYKALTGKTSPITIVPFKGEYYKLKPGAYQSDIPIYPVPNPDFPFLGIHITKMIDGTAKLGPNAVLILNREGYDGSSIKSADALSTLTNKGLYKMILKYRRTIAKEVYKQSQKSFYMESVKKYWKTFTWDMVDGYTSGIRAQAMDKNGLVEDFVIEKYNNQIHVLNAPSPAATSSLSIADRVLRQFKN